MMAHTAATLLLSGGVNPNVCTLFGRPEMAEPSLCEEFLAIVEAFFMDTVTVVRSTVATVAAQQPSCDAA